MTQKVRYILVHKEDQSPAMWCSQSDREYPITSGTLIGLIGEAAEWADLSLRDFMRIFAETGGAIHPADGEEKYEILREDVTVSPVSDTEREAFKLKFGHFWEKT